VLRFCALIGAALIAHLTTAAVHECLEGIEVKLVREKNGRFQYSTQLGQLSARDLLVVPIVFSTVWCSADPVLPQLIGDHLVAGETLQSVQ